MPGKRHLDDGALHPDDLRRHIERPSDAVRIEHPGALREAIQVLAAAATRGRAGADDRDGLAGGVSARDLIPHGAQRADLIERVAPVHAIRPCRRGEAVPALP